MISLILISNSSLELSTYTSESWQEQKQKQKQKHCRTPHALFHNFKFIHPCTFSMWLAGMVAIFKPDLTTSNGKIDIWKFLFNFGSELMLIVDVCFPLVLVLAHRYFYVYIYFIYNNCSCSAFSNITNFYSVTCCMYNQSYCGCELGMSLSWVVFNIYMYIKIRHKNITQTIYTILHVYTIHHTKQNEPHHKKEHVKIRVLLTTTHNDKHVKNSLQGLQTLVWNRFIQILEVFKCLAQWCCKNLLF